MASLTIRKLDEGVKAHLRLRSAQNGRSVEEEVRVILRETIQGRPEAGRQPAASRYCRRQMPRPGPPAALARPIKPASPSSSGAASPPTRRST